VRRVAKGWPKLADTRYLGKRVSRVDGPVKVSGRAKYTYDINRPDMLFAKFVLCPYGRAQVKSIDVSQALAMPGVVIARAMQPDGYEANYAGAEVAVIAADSEERARAAARAVRVDWKVLPHNVVDDPTGPIEELGEEWVRKPRTREEGDVEAAFTSADVISEGDYGCPIIAHCCLEAHGSVAEFPDEDHLNVWISTQNVSGVGEGYERTVGVEGANIDVQCQHMGGGFGSKFGMDAWDAEAASIAEETGRPVKAMIERDHEIAAAGSRPSLYARVRVALNRDGTIVGWDSAAWGSGGGSSLPYIFGGIPNRRSASTNIRTNAGPARRNDSRTAEIHRDLLSRSDDRELTDIYDYFWRSIQRFYSDELSRTGDGD